MVVNTCSLLPQLKSIFDESLVDCMKSAFFIELARSLFGSQLHLTHSVQILAKSSQLVRLVLLDPVSHILYDIIMSKTIANPNLPPPPTGKYPAKDHARRVAKWIAENGGPSIGIIYLEGTSEKIVEVRFLNVRRLRRH